MGRFNLFLRLLLSTLVATTGFSFFVGSTSSVASDDVPEISTTSLPDDFEGDLPGVIFTETTSTTVVVEAVVSDDGVSSPCEVLRYLDELDRSSGYSVTHSIIGAGGPEDTLTVGLEGCE